MMQNLDGTWYGLLGDGLGSVREVWDGARNPIYSTDYAPYGTLRETVGVNPSPFAFTGQPRDANGLQYHRARYYDPHLANWLSLDPIETYNRYTYANSNPVNAVDPTGLFPTIGDINQGIADFTCKCGWLDWNHLRKSEELSFEILEHLRFAESNFTLHPTVGERWAIDVNIPLGFAGFEYLLFSDRAVVPNSEISSSSRLPLAVSIFMDANQKFEFRQRNFSENVFVRPTPFRNRLSSSFFSEEDLPSNIIGFYVAYQRHIRGDVSVSSEAMYDEAVCVKDLQQLQ